MRRKTRYLLSNLAKGEKDPEKHNYGKKKRKTDDNGNVLFQSYLSTLFKKETG